MGGKREANGRHRHLVTPTGELTSDLSPQRAAPDLELSHRAICSRGRDRLEDASVSSRARVCSAPGGATAFMRGCCTKASAKTWAALPVTVAEGARSADAGQGAQRASEDLRLF